MKRLILHILFAIVLTGNDVWADTCSDLGYTQTSVSSCAGEYLVCPMIRQKFTALKEIRLLPILFPTGHLHLL